MYEVVEDLHHIFWDGEDFEFPAGRHEPGSHRERAALEHLVHAAEWLPEETARALARLVEPPDDAPSGAPLVGTITPLPTVPPTAPPSTATPPGDAAGIDLSTLDAAAAQAAQLDDLITGEGDPQP